MIYIDHIIRGYKCCVPRCKSNYDSESKDGNQKSVSTFGFPKDQQIRHDKKHIHEIYLTLLNRHEFV